MLGPLPGRWASSASPVVSTGLTGAASCPGPCTAARRWERPGGGGVRVQSQPSSAGPPVLSTGPPREALSLARGCVMAASAGRPGGRVCGCVALLAGGAACPGPQGWRVAAASRCRERFGPSPPPRGVALSGGDPP